MIYGPARYAKIRIGNGYQLIRIIRETKTHVTGMRVNHDGSNFERETETATQSFMVICKPENIVRHLRLNLHYGELESMS